MLNGVPVVSELLVGGLNITNIAMRERKTSYLHQFPTVGADWVSKSNSKQRQL